MKLLDQTSLRNRITFGMLLGILLTVWLTTLLASRVLRSEMEAAISAQQLSALALAAKNVDQSLRERIVAIKEVADHLSRSSTPLNQQQRFLEDLVILPQMFNWGIFIADVKGVAQASVPAHLNRTGTDYSGNPAIRAALEQGKLMVTDPMKGKKLDNLWYPSLLP